jgi:hypothetical protein
VFRQDAKKKIMLHRVFVWMILVILECREHARENLQS